MASLPDTTTTTISTAISTTTAIAVNWDLTYACPLRCVHCYSESGRRRAQQLAPQQMAEVVDALVALRPAGVALAGGEPLLVRDLPAIAHRLTAAGISVSLYTSGWLLDNAAAESIVPVVSQIHVSLDGATAEVHDRIRGRAGSFVRALRALALLDEIARRQRLRGERPLRFGIDGVVVRSNVDRLAEFLTRIVPRFPQLSFVTLGAAVPAGLASRADFADRELLDDRQLSLLSDADHHARLQAMAPGVEITITDNLALRHPPAAGPGGGGLLQVEADGSVRAIPVFEGTVGNLRTESVDVLWRRGLDRWHHPVVVEALASVHGLRDWAAAARTIDHHFGSPETRRRIERRPAFSVTGTTGA